MFHGFSTHASSPLAFYLNLFTQDSCFACALPNLSGFCPVPLVSFRPVPESVVSDGFRAGMQASSCSWVSPNPFYPSNFVCMGNIQFSLGSTPFCLSFAQVSLPKPVLLHGCLPNAVLFHRFTQAKLYSRIILSFPWVPHSFL
jgi:hypothetical protein